MSIEIVFLSALADATWSDKKSAQKFFLTSNVGDDDFTLLDNARAFRAIESAFRDGLSVTAEVLADGLAKEGVKNPMGLALKITEEAGSAFMLPGSWGRVRAEADKRRSVKLLKSALMELESPGSDVDSLRSRVGAELLKTRSCIEVTPLSDYVEKMADHMDSVIAGKIQPLIPTGLRQLDEAISGWQPTLTMIGAEPGVGKSALLAAAVQSLGRRGIKSAVFSLEDEPSWLAWRLLSSESRIPQKKLRFERVSNSDYEKTAEAASRVFDTTQSVYCVNGSDRSVSIDDIVATSHDLVQNKGVKVIFVDHLGEIPTPGGDRHDLEVSNHIQALRQVANKYQVPVVLFAHTRRVEAGKGGEEDRAPKMSDFANTSGAERKARVALILRRKPGSDTIVVHVVKQTNGIAGISVPLGFDGLAAMVCSTEDK